jgi:hypothetical protein
MTLHFNSENTVTWPNGRSGRTEKLSIETGPSVKVDFSLFIKAKRAMLAAPYPFNITACDVTVYLNRINIRSLNRLEVKEQESTPSSKTKTEPQDKKSKTNVIVM